MMKKFVMLAVLSALAGCVCFAGEIQFIAPAEAWNKDVIRGSALAKAVTNAKAVKAVTIDASALGCFELYVGGKLVSVEADGNRADFLRPGFTQFDKRRGLLTYDLTPWWNCAAKAENQVAAFVSPAWYADGIGGAFGQTPALAARLKLTYADGTSEVVETGTDWTASYDTPYLRTGIYEGELYDARHERDAFACAGKTAAVVVSAFKGTLEKPRGAEVYLRRDLALAPVEAYVWRGTVGAAETNAFGRVKILRRYQPGEPMTLQPGEQLVLDFGQNAAAIPEVVATAAAGVALTVKGGEMLNDGYGEKARGNDGPAGSVYFANYRGLKGDGQAEVTYVFAGKGTETYLPSFTFMGYRYARVTATGPVEIERIVSIPVTSVAKADERGTLKTGNADVNRLIKNCLWGQYSNYLSVPTDCPQRDERMGWTADTQVFAAAAFRNADVYRFFEKWMTDMRDAQDSEGRYPSVAPTCRWGDCGRARLGWADAGIIVPWTCWRMTGKTDIIVQNWESMCRFLEFQTRTRYATPDNFQFGDWVAYEQISPSGYWAEGHAWDPNYVLPETLKYWDYLAGCYWYWNAKRMAAMAAAIGKEQADIDGFNAVAVKARTYLKNNFFAADGGLLECFRHLQTPALFALHLELYDLPAAKASAIDGLMRNFIDHGDCLQTGFLGTSILMDAVTYGAKQPKMAYTLLLQHKNPSWLYSVDQGATTMWERWNSYVKDRGFGDVGMNSFNHYAYGAVLDWMYGTMAGIQPGAQGGFDDFVLAPIPDARLGSVEATYRNSHGVIKSAWNYASGRCQWTFTIPEGSSARVRVKGTEQTYAPGTYSLDLESEKPAANDTAYSFGLIGDTHFSRPENYATGGNRARHERWLKETVPHLRRAAAACMSEPAAQFFVHTGDMVDGRTGTLARQIDQLTEGWRLTRGCFPPEVPFLAANGNHETYDFEAPGTYAYPGYAATVQKFIAEELGLKQPVERHYAFRKGKDLFLFYNSNVDEYDFFRRELAANPDARWVFAIGHIPVINPVEGGIELDSPWAGNFMENHNRFLHLLQSRNVIVLCGDTHRVGFVDYVTGEGRLTEVMGASVCDNGSFRELGTTVGDFPGNWNSGFAEGGVISERQRFLKSGLVRNWLASGAGFWKLRVDDERVTADFYAWDQPGVVKSFQVRGPETAVESVKLEVARPLKPGVTRLPVRLSAELAARKDVQWRVSLPSGWTAAPFKPAAGVLEVTVPVRPLRRRDEVAIKLYATEHRSGRIVAQDDRHFLQQSVFGVKATAAGLDLSGYVKDFNLRPLGDLDLAVLPAACTDENQLWPSGKLLELFFDLKGVRATERTGDSVQLVVAKQEGGGFRVFVIRDAGRTKAWADLEQAELIPWELIAPSGDLAFRPQPGQLIALDAAFANEPLFGATQKFFDDPSKWAWAMVR